MFAISREAPSLQAISSEWDLGSIGAEYQHPNRDLGSEESAAAHASRSMNLGPRLVSQNYPWICHISKVISFRDSGNEQAPDMLQEKRGFMKKQAVVATSSA